LAAAAASLRTVFLRRFRHGVLFLFLSGGYSRHHIHHSTLLMVATERKAQKKPPPEHCESGSGRPGRAPPDEDLEGRARSDVFKPSRGKAN
jgi:hypothetical protein